MNGSVMDLNWHTSQADLTVMSEDVPGDFVAPGIIAVVCFYHGTTAPDWINIGVYPQAKLPLSDDVACARSGRYDRAHFSGNNFSAITRRFIG